MCLSWTGKREHLLLLIRVLLTVILQTVLPILLLIVRAIIVLAIRILLLMVLAILVPRVLGRLSLPLIAGGWRLLSVPFTFALSQRVALFARSFLRTWCSSWKLAFESIRDCLHGHIFVLDLRHLAHHAYLS